MKKNLKTILLKAQLMLGFFCHQNSQSQPNKILISKTFLNKIYNIR